MLRETFFMPRLELQAWENNTEYSSSSEDGKQRHQPLVSNSTLFLFFKLSQKIGHMSNSFCTYVHGFRRELCVPLSQTHLLLMSEI